MVSPILTLSHLGTSPNIVRYCTVNCIIAFLLYIQLFKENSTIKFDFVLIVLPCMQTTKRYIHRMFKLYAPGTKENVVI